MIETHVINALLSNDLKHETFFAILTFINGLVAPTFLFCAGFAFAISSHRKWQEFRSFKSSARKYALRLFFILIVGYTLHIPFFSFRRMSQINDLQTWTSFFMVDILQIIAVTLLILLFISILLRKEEYLFYVATFLTIVVIYASPLVNTVEVPFLPIWLRGYVSVKYLSQFTLFPWSAFLLTGYILGFGYIRSFEHNQQTIIHNTVWISILIIFSSIICTYLPIDIYQGNSFWNSPQFVFLRLGIVVLLGSFLWYLENRSGSPQTISPKTSNSLVLLFGKESLPVYTVHLIIVYGHNFTWSYVSLFGERLSYINCIILYIILTTGMYLMAYSWSQLKSWNLTYARMTQYAILAIIIVKFIISE